MRTVALCCLSSLLLACAQTHPAQAPDCAAGGDCEAQNACGDASGQDSCFAAQAAGGDTVPADPSVPSATDACTQDNGGCSPLVSCSSDAGTVRCGTCPQGYAGSGLGHAGCADVDECAQGSHGCVAPEVCMNEPGSFRCELCQPGTSLQGGACVPRWTHAIATAGEDHARGIAVDAQDAVLVAGSTSGQLPDETQAGGQDAFVVKYDNAGKLVYARQFGTASDEIVTDIVVDGNDNAYVFGSTEGRFEGNQAAGGSDLFIAKLDKAGELQWIRQFGSAADDSSAGAGFDAGALYLTGFTEGDLSGAGSAGSSDAFVAKYQPSGEQAWLRQFGSASSDVGAAVGVDTTGGVFVTGETSGVLGDGRNLGGSDLFVVKYNAQGDAQWSSELGTIGDDSGFAVATVEGGNAYIVGTTGGALASAPSAGHDDALVLKYDAGGTPQWLRQFGSTEADGASAVAVDNFGGAWVTGVARGKLDQTAEAAGLFVTKYDSAGALKWAHQPADMGAAVPTDIAIDRAGNAYVTGFSADAVDGMHSRDGGTDAFVLKFDATGARL